MQKRGFAGVQKDLREAQYTSWELPSEGVQHLSKAESRAVAAAAHALSMILGEAPGAVPRNEEVSEHIE